MRFTQACFVLLACTLLGSCAKTEDPEEKPVIQVKVASAESADIPVTVTAPAAIFPREQANITARITARIAQLRAKKGDNVGAGQLLAVLENRDAIAAQREARGAVENAQAALQKTVSGTVPTDVERARAQVESTRAVLNQAEQVYSKRQQLFQEGAIPERDLLQSKTDLATARANYESAQRSYDLLVAHTRERDVEMARSNLEQARARLDAANAQLQFTEIRAPFSGSITDQLQYPGDIAQPANPIYTLMDLSMVTARAQVPEEKAGAVRTKQNCTFTPGDPAAGLANGRVTVVNRAVDPQRRTIEVWCEIMRPPVTLRAGAFGSVTISVQVIPAAVVVPAPAVQFEEGTNKGTVFVVQNHIAHKRNVEGGEKLGERVQIKSGIRPGETVITEGAYGLPDNAQVRLPGEKASGGMKE